MNATTPRLRAHLLAELRDLDDQTATTDQLAGQVPCPWALDYADGAPSPAYIEHHPQPDGAILTAVLAVDR